MDGRSGAAVARGVELASLFAEGDPYRAATHNKGIMNGVDAVALATGNDWRALEAGAHAFAARDGRYGSLSTWRIEGEALVGRLEMPMALGTVGATVEGNPRARLALKLALVLNDKLERGQDALSALEGRADQGDEPCREAYVEYGLAAGWKGIVATKLIEWNETAIGSVRQESLGRAFDLFIEVEREADARTVALELSASPPISDTRAACGNHTRSGTASRPCRYG